MKNGEPRFTGEIRLHPQLLSEPLKWRKPRKVFVSEMSDLFHEDVPDEFIAAVFGVMAASPQHTFQVLTKRAERMLRWFSEYGRSANATPSMVALALRIARDVARPHALPTAVIRLAGASVRAERNTPDTPPWPLPNVWLGVSAEDQQRADERIPLLLQCPAAVHWASLEPLLGPIVLRHPWFPVRVSEGHFNCAGDYRMPTDNRLSWAVVGGESGPGARPCHLRWVTSLKDQCAEAGVKLFLKQLGSQPIVTLSGSEPDRMMDYATKQAAPSLPRLEQDVVLSLKHSKGGDISEWPKDLQVREYPQVRA